MERFMIGQFGRYNHEKHIRDFKPNFFGVEACLLGEEDIKELIKTANDEKFSIGIHFPLRTNGWRLRDPQFLSKDDETRRSSYDYMEKEINFLKDVRPKYILFHYPKPVVLDKSVDWTNWRFADDTEYYLEDDYSYQSFVTRSEELFSWLTDISMKNDFIPVLELDALNKYVYATDLLEILLDKYPRVKICLDIGRLHLQERLDENFNSFEFASRFAKYAEIIHLWNIKVTDNVEFSHYPPLPSLIPEEGWGDIRKYLEIINKENNSCKIMFEHRSDLISDEELISCYNWIKNILNEGLKF